MKRLGVGAFAQVWQCKDLKTGGQVAVKVLKSDSFVREMGEEEADLLQKLVKSGKEELLIFLDQFWKKGPNGRHLCLVTELCGPCLLDVLPENGMCLSNVKQVMGQVLAGLEFLHLKGIIHTDVKPENVLLSNNASSTNFSSAVEAIKVKLADFGGALQVGEIFPAIVGTSEYRAPELLLEAPYDAGIDVWAVACLGFELATGEYLFRPEVKRMVPKEEMHLALVTKLLGPAPQDLVSSGRAGKLLYSRRRGELHHFSARDLGCKDLRKLIGERRGKAETGDNVFSGFLLSMLRWRPEERVTAARALLHEFLSERSFVHSKTVRMSIVEPADILQDLDKKMRMDADVTTFEHVARLNETSKSVKAPMLVELANKERPGSSVGNIDLVAHSNIVNEERPLTQVAERVKNCEVNVVRQIKEAHKKGGKGRGRERKNDRKRLSEGVKQDDVDQHLIIRKNGKVVKLTAEKMTSSSDQAGDLQGPPFKRARRSAEVRSSCPWEVDLMLELPKPTWRSSEVMRKSGRPMNVKGSKMLPMGPLRCYARETIKVEQVGEGGGLVGGFIDDVVNGERLVMDRRAKEFAYYTLRLKVLFWLNVWSINMFNRQRTDGGLKGSQQAQAEELQSTVPSLAFECMLKAPSNVG